MAVWSEVSFREAMLAGRLDAEYYMPHLLDLENRLKKMRAVPLGELGTLVCSAFYPAATELYASGDTPFIRCVDIISFPIVTAGQNFARIPAEFIRNSGSIRCVGPGDIVISKVGTPCFTSLIDSTMSISAMTRTVLGIRNLDTCRVDPRYLVLYLRSPVGFDQLMRERELTIQYQLTLERTRNVKVFLPPMERQRAIGEMLSRHVARLDESNRLYAEAERLLLRELGLADLDLSPQLFYERRYSETVAARRLDAEYFSPRVQRVLTKLRQQGKTLRDVAKLAKRRFRPERGAPFNYIEIGDVQAEGSVTASEVAGEEAPSRAVWLVQPGDVITSTVRPIRRLSALIEQGQDGYVCSSGFAVLRPVAAPAELLLVYLRLPIIAEILDLHTTASMYPAISTTDLLKVPFLAPSDNAVRTITEKIQESRATRQESQRLLADAKRMVEEMILGMAT
jgi:hypothetical protein